MFSRYEVHVWVYPVWEGSYQLGMHFVAATIAVYTFHRTCVHMKEPKLQDIISFILLIQFLSIIFIWMYTKWLLKMIPTFTNIPVGGLLIRLYKWRISTPRRPLHLQYALSRNPFSKYWILRTWIRLKYLIVTSLWLLRREQLFKYSTAKLYESCEHCHRPPLLSQNFHKKW